MILMGFHLSVTGYSICLQSVYQSNGYIHEEIWVHNSKLDILFVVTCS
jgi:hypothetical protein